MSDWDSIAATAKEAPADVFAPAPIEVPKPFKDLIAASLVKGGIHVDIVATVTGNAEVDAKAQTEKVAAFSRLLRAAAAQAKNDKGEDVSISIKNDADGKGVAFKVTGRRGRKAAPPTTATPTTDAKPADTAAPTTDAKPAEVKPTTDAKPTEVKPTPATTAKPSNSAK